MADTKTSALTAFTTPIGADTLPIYDSTNTTLKQMALSTMHYKYINYSTAAQGAGFATDTYVTGSNISIPSGGPYAGSLYRCLITVSKTAAGSATPIIQLRIGTLGTTGDASICSFTFSAGTAATDVGVFEVIGLFRTVGAGTSAVVQGHCSLVSQPTTGFSSLLHGVQTTSAGFNSTTASLIAGVSVNGGASAAWTVQLVRAELML
jgi:hypothetical protein